MERFKKLAASVAALKENGWMIVKFSLVFLAVFWFSSRNLGGTEIGILVAVSVTALSVANWKIFDKASDAFLDVEEEDDALEKSKKTAAAIFKRIFYTVLDYSLAVASIALVVWAKSAGLSYLVAVALMWSLIDITSAGFSVALYERTGRDITLGRSYRRMANVIMDHSKVAGVIVFTYEIVIASFWSGPDYTILFFKDNLKTRTEMAIALVAITVAHAFLWTAVYWTGAEDIANLASKLF